MQQKAGHIETVNLNLSNEWKVSFMIFSAEQENSCSMNFLYQSLKGKSNGDSEDSLCDSAKDCCIMSKGN